MNSINFNFAASAVLTRDQMKNVLGASRKPVPSTPLGTLDAEIQQSLVVVECVGKMCCWNDDPSTCSDCKDGLSGDAFCPDDASFLAPCHC